jgi:radical SAM superfamily enzyme YgiQ (UPF0313 family)
MLPKEWRLRLVDANIADIENKDLEWASIVFVSAMAIQRETARKVIARSKSAGCVVIAGGPLFSAECEDFEEVDHFILGEAEISLPLFLHDFERHCAKRLYKTEEFADLSATPAPAWSLLDLDQYASMSIQYSRGCPFNCEFCNVTVLFGHRARVKSAAQVIAELDLLYDLGWRRRVFFVDDNFIGHKKALKTELLPALIDWQKDKRGVTFYTQVSINLADDQELMDLMAAAGFNAVFVGIETPAEEALAECNKQLNQRRNLLEDVKILTRNGFLVQGGFIIGFDNDSPSVFQRQIDFIQGSGIVTAMVGLLQALPGTQLWERLEREGRLQGISSGDNVDGMTNIVPRMDLERLRSGYYEILNHIYAPRHFYSRVKVCLQELRMPKISPCLDVQYVLAFFRSLWHLGVKGEERLHYWKLLVWTMVHRPMFFPLAVMLAIHGYHLRKTCRFDMRK